MHNLENILELTYAPLTIFEFDNSRNDSYIYDCLTLTSLYVIAKRTLPIMKLRDGASNGFHLEISMENCDSQVEIIMTQKDNPNLFGTGLSGIKRHSNLSNTSDEYFHALTLIGENNRFIMHANFDRLIHLASNGAIGIKTKGDFTQLLSYEVLYVGKCTDEHIFDRFKTHHALLDILINEKIVPSGYDKVNDLLILPFCIQSDVISVINGDTSEQQFIEAFSGNFAFNCKNIALDCEKALIKAMSPKYNKTKFKHYPKSQDGLYNKGLQFIAYKIGENLILKYENENCIIGDVTGLSPTSINILGDYDFFIE
ncbi:hypothetical protein [Sinanaerobacter sp. ZZT-01]|uniref:hypothetical protein n=1 Tax=Sinanaerobacter sp. ZZT-01 TaxID=3111540 RepID=UPI002D79D0B4|nr:hypothetical protein [Sinanaerobacter sp. ZZT-01]WRR93893.1 hypothetical protein U5921_01850 [Sinanaerobacter sp. ZZT-01]